MSWIRLALMLYFFMVAHKAPCQNPVESLVENHKEMVRGVVVLEIILTKDS